MSRTRLRAVVIWLQNKTFANSNLIKILYNLHCTCNFAARAHRTSYAMNKVYFRNLPGSSELHISFRFQNQKNNVDREFNFCRNINEKVDDALVRIRTNIEKELEKKNKKLRQRKKKQTSSNMKEQTSEQNSEAIEIDFISNDGIKIAGVSFAEMIQNPNDMMLRVINEDFKVVFNEPWVVNLVLPASILAGCLLYPSKVELQFANNEYCQGTWYKAKIPGSGDLQNGATWIKCGQGFFYNTTNDDIGHHIKFQLIPGNYKGIFGPVVENITKNAVQAGPGHCPFEDRHSFTTNRLTGDVFRIVSYNILADLYANSEYSRNELFPYCPPYALRIEYRKQLLVKEILGYNADIVCLQEVDIKVFSFDLKPILETDFYKFAGQIQQKGTSGEGVATFFRKDRFKLVRTFGLNIGDSIQTLPEFFELWNKIRTNEKLVQRIIDRSTTLQLTLLRSKDTGKYLLVANTHLYFHPDADHIRLLQFAFSMLYVESIYQSTIRDLNVSEENISIIFCGDFNSVPECGIYKLMTEKFVASDFIDWKSNMEEAVKDVSVFQPFSIKSACGTPKYTNFTHAFAACLDYIFYQCDRLEVEQVIPLPSEKELRSHIAIPSVVFPSDHVALVADLKFGK